MSFDGTELAKLTASQASAGLEAGAITSEALVRACLERIDDREGQVGAWTYLDADLAIAQARAADGSNRRGRLHGIPVAVKDLIDTSDMPTGYGSAAYAGHRPAADAACVALLKESGAIVLGKTVTTEFAAVTPGKTRNPHDPGRSPGGSSSGSAAAVADFMVPLALGTQTVGSTIRPASYCGAVGFKPTRGTFSLAGVKAQAETFDTLGLMSRCVDDVVLLGDALLRGFAGMVGTQAGTQAGTRAGAPKIGVSRTPHWPKAEPATVRVLDEVVAMLRDAGAEVADCHDVDGFDDALDAHWLILCFEFARALSFERTHRRSHLSEALLGLLDRGMDIALGEYRDALAAIESRRKQMPDIFGRFDILLTPGAAGEAPSDPRAPSDLLFQRLWTALDLPVATLPGFVGDAGLPIGIQLVGPAHGEGVLLARARWVEEVIAGAGRAASAGA